MNSPSQQPPHKSSGQNQLPDGLGACLLLAGIGLLLLALPFVLTEKSVTTQTLQGLGWILTALGIVGGLLLWPRISRSLRSMELAMAGSHDGMFEWDPLTKRLIVGRRLLDILGYSHDFLPTSDAWLQIVHPDDRALYNKAVTAHLKGQTDHFYCEYRVKAHNGEYRWLAARGLVAHTGRKSVRLMAGSVTDITERVMREQHMHRLARTDHLTGLPNRRALLEQLPQALTHAQERQGLVGVLCIDLDRFKNVNDTLGHWAGDELLQALAQRLPSALRSIDVLARQGGDELIVLLTGITNMAEACQVAQRLLVYVAEPVQLGDHTLQLTASIGMALFPLDGIDTDTLLRHADMAMYEAKNRGGDQWQCYTPDLDARLTQRVTLENKLRNAIEAQQLCLHYQPQLDAQTGALVGAEALLRWTDQGQAIGPDVFIRVAEESGLIDTLGKMVMHQSLQQLNQWLPHLPPGFRLSVNLSPRQFRASVVDMDWFSAIGLYGVPCANLALEITESVLLDADGSAIQALARLRRAGIEIALDDFGTGYSSLSYLSVLEFDVLKIDKSFVMGLTVQGTADKPDRSTAVVDATLAMAHKLGYRVVAEGVETAAQHQWLCRQGCDVVQGYLFSPALPPTDFAAKYLASA